MRNLILLFAFSLPLFAATGSWNGVAFTAWNGIAQTAWNGTSISCASASTSPGTSSIVAWYDFANGNDADGGTYNLTAQGGPTYQTALSPEYGIATDGTPGTFWQQSTIGSNFGHTSGSWALVIRFRGYTSVSSGDRVVSGNGTRWFVAWGSPMQVKVANVTINTGTTPSLGTWYLAVIQYDQPNDQLSYSINGQTLVTSSGTEAFVSGTYLFGATSSSDSNNFHIDYAAFYAKVLTQSNVDWFYNSGETRTYSEL